MQLHYSDARDDDDDDDGDDDDDDDDDDLSVHSKIVLHSIN